MMYLNETCTYKIYSNCTEVTLWEKQFIEMSNPLITRKRNWQYIDFHIIEEIILIHS